MKYLNSIILLCFYSIAINAQNLTLNCPNTDPIVTAWKISDGISTMKYYTNINDTDCPAIPIDSGVEANVQSVYYDAEYVWVEATGCPDYFTGPYNGDGNINFPDDQNLTIVLPRNPIPDPGASLNDHTVLGAIGYFVNGVPMFNAADGMSYNNQGSWNRNATVMENEGFGCDRSHPANISLHHHQNPIPFNYSENGTQNPDICDCFPSDALYSPNPEQHSPIIGFANDGYPVYGPYAFSNTDGTGEIRLMTPSYHLRAINERTTYADGSNAPNAGPVISDTWPLGSFYEDFEFIEGSGDLDYYNGRFAVTPEYPCGTYAYFATMDENGDSKFPYLVGLAFYGETINCNAGGGPGGGPGDPPPCSEVPEGLPCCGDGICGGPETADNCPEDCGGGGSTGGTDEYPCTQPDDVLLYAETNNISPCNNELNIINSYNGDGTNTLTVSGNSNEGNWCTSEIGASLTVNENGTYTYFDTDENGFYQFISVYVDIQTGLNEIHAIKSLEIYPIPVDEVLTIILEVEKVEKYIFNIKDITGKIINSEHKQVQAGTNELLLETEALNNGIYFLQIVNENGEHYLRKIVK